MGIDITKNFSKTTLSTGYDSSAVSVDLETGDGAKLPDTAASGSFNVVWWNATDYGDPSDDPNVEIVRCTNRSTDTLTITRAQEGTSASNHNTANKTYKMILSLTKKTMDELDSHLSGHSDTPLWSELDLTVSDIADITTKIHSSLSSLGSDDHTQYILADGTRLFTGNQSFGDFNITNVGDISLDSISDDAGVENTLSIANLNTAYDHTSLTNDPHNITWGQVDKTVSDIADIATKSHTSLSNIGVNAHTAIDTHIAGSGASVHGDSFLLNTGDTGTGDYIIIGDLTVKNGSDNLLLVDETQFRAEGLSGAYRTAFNVDYDDSTFGPTIYGSTTRDANQRL